MPAAVVMGAGLAGLTAAALLVRSGWSVDLLEAHVDPGGCAATFRRGGYAFDAGATLFAGFGPAEAHGRVASALGLRWPVHAVPGEEPAMRVWLASSADDPSEVVDCYGDVERWRAERRRAFPGAAAARFWNEQESVARRLWPLAAEVPVWPPERPADLVRLATFGARSVVSDPGLLGLASRWCDTVANRLAAAGVSAPNTLPPGTVDRTTLPSTTRFPGTFPAAPGIAERGASVTSRPSSAGLGDLRLRRFCDAQLLITAQATADTASWLYGAVALDLARHGTVHVAGGAGALAQTLVRRYTELGGRLHFRTRAAALDRDHRGRAVAVRDTRGRRWPEHGPASAVIANLPPADLCRLLGDGCPPALRRRVEARPRAWGAFTLYLGVDADAVPAGPLHHQIVAPGGALGEGRSVFVSISPAWDGTRAPPGQRAVTISTHTAVEPWWEYYRQRTAAARDGYRQRRADYAARCLSLAAHALPQLAAHPDRVRLMLPGTPITFARFTRRAEGRVGGLPQTSLGAAFPAGVLPGLWLVGDSIFPGQSSAATLLGALRVARAIWNSRGEAGLASSGR